MKRSAGKGGRSSPRVHLAAFGKHPGWDDHIEEIGIETEDLAALKQLLYVQGIGGIIDSGAWDRLSESHRVEGFRHVFVARGAGGIVAGRLWSSRDGKGRTRYPMVVCAQCVGLPLEWVLREVLPRLEEVQARCVQTTSALDVIAIMEDTRQALRQKAQGVPPGQPDLALSRGALAQIADCPEMGPDRQGILRILYQMQREMSAYLPGDLERAARTGELRPVQIRVPACEGPVGQVVQRWFSFMLSRLDAATPLCVIPRLDRPWVDILVGDPAPTQFFCFQASREAAALASEVPYTLDEAFVAEAEQAIAASRSGQAEQIAVKPVGATAVRRPPKPPRDISGALNSVARSPSMRWALAVLAIAALAIVALWAFSKFYAGQPRRPDAARLPDQGMSKSDSQTWEKLCRDYRDWFKGFWRDVEKDRQARWASDAHLQQNVLSVVERARSGQFDPQKIAEEEASYLDDLIRNPPAKLRSPEKLEQVRQAAGAIQSVREALGAKSWPALAGLERLAAECKERGRSKPAAYLASVIAQVQFGPGLPAAVDEVLATGKLAGSLQSLDKSVEDQTRILAESGDALLAKWGLYVQAETRSTGEAGTRGDLEALIAKLQDIQSRWTPFAAFVKTDWKTKVDKAWVGKRPPVAVPDSAEQLKGGGIFLTWLAKVQTDEYRILDPADDPRTKGEWKDDRQRKNLAAIARRIEELASKYGRNVSAFRARLKAHQDELESISRKTWDHENRSELLKLAAAFPGKYAPLDREVGVLIAEAMGGHAGYVASLPESISERSAEINELWRARRDELKKITDLGVLKPKVDRLNDDLVKLDAELPDALKPPPATARDWARRIQTEVVAAKREGVLKEALGGLGWRDGAIVRDGAFEDRWKKLRAGFDGWLTEAAKLVAAMDEVESALAAGALPDEPLPAGGKSVAGVYGEWANRPVLQDQAVRSALKPLIDRLESLAAVAKSSDRKELGERALTAVAGRFETARAAWKRLGQLPAGWPAEGQEFARERDIRDRLKAVYDLVPEAARRTQLQNELVAEGRRRWETYFLGRTGPAEMADAVDRMAEFHLDAASIQALAPFTRFRIDLWRFQQDMLSSAAPAEDKAIRERIQAFIASVSALPGGLDKKPPVAVLLAELGKIAAGEGGADFSKAGPGLAGWRAKASPDGNQVQYVLGEGDQRKVLEFILVKPQGQDKPTYLCTTEMSAGLLLDTVRTPPQRMQEVVELLQDYGSGQGDSRLGPRTWEFEGQGDQRKLVEAKDWIVPSPRIPAGLLYAGGLSPGSPRRGHPAQYISAQAAVYISALLGCRLPTTAEWTSAHAAYVKGQPGGPDNLRDRTWDKQRSHMAGEEIQRKGITPLFPDEEIFWPRGFTQRLTGADAKAADSDDGILWFAEVDSDKPRRIHHLVGNVAEFIHEKPALLADQKDLGARQVMKLVKAEDLRVIGGSALSAPKLPVMDPQPVDPAVIDAKGAYSDVGFRPAFTAPAEPLLGRLRRVLQAAASLQPPAGG